ncbi:MAG TPA: glucoamylase family protein [Candidatus Acidoferrales bacterium]|nr:glucoamylase family protein [Candidatus Acidoferrales bacterium]
MRRPSSSIYSQMIFRSCLLTIVGLQCLTVPRTLAQSIHYPQRSYILDDFDNDTTTNVNDFFGTRGVWYDSAALIDASYISAGGRNYSLRLTYDVSDPSAQCGWWEKFTYLYSDPDNPVFDISDFDEFRFSVRGDSSYAARFYIEFVQGNFQKQKRIEVDGITASFQEKVIPLKDSLAGFDLTQIRHVAVVLDSSLTKKRGDLYFDNFYFVNKHEGYSNDSTFLDLISKKAFRYFVEQVDPVTGLVRDRAGNFDLTSIAAVGFQLTALGIGAERGWITRDSAASDAKKILNTLSARQDSSANGSNGFKGFYYHMMGIGTGLRDGTSELSSIDASLFFAGVMFAREYFNGSASGEIQIRALADTIIDRVNWRWMLDALKNQFYMAWTPADGFSYSHWDYYTDEAILVSFLAIGSGKVDPSVFYAWQRVPAAYGDYTFRQSWWGSLFTYLFAHCWIDFKKCGYDQCQDSVNWWDNSVQAVKADRQFCIDSSASYSTYSDSSWGLTACFGPGGYNGGMSKSYGAFPLADPPANHDGTIAPYGAGGSIVFFDPENNESIHALKNYYNNYPRLWGIYGFKDAFNLGRTADSTDDWYANDYVGLDVGTLLLMIENYRTGLVWNYFSKNKQVAAAIKAIFNKDIAAVKKNAGDIPLSNSLHHNFPNPFNPSTVISYRLSAVSDVTLKVYDVLGREVKTLVDEHQTAGNYSVTLNAANLPSGVYFYRLQAGSYIATKKLLLLK